MYGSSSTGGTNLNFSRPSNGRNAALRRLVAIKAMYDEPRELSSLLPEVVRRSYTQFYWLLRQMQFSFFYEFTEPPLDLEDEVVLPLAATRRASVQAICNTGGLTREYAKRLYVAHKRQCPSGQMDQPAFSRMFREMFPHSVNDAYARRVFAAIRPNAAAKFLTFMDLVSFSAKLHREDSASRVRWIWRLINTEPDRAQIDVLTFVHYVQDVQALNANAEHYIVIKNTEEGVINRPMSAQQLAEAAALAHEIFQKIDIDQDGFISEQDYVQFITQDQNRCKDMQALLDGIFDLRF